MEGFKWYEFTFIEEFSRFIYEQDLIQYWESELILMKIDEKLSTIRLLHDSLKEESLLKETTMFIEFLFFSFCEKQLEEIRYLFISLFKQLFGEDLNTEEFLTLLEDLERKVRILRTKVENLSLY